MNVDNVENDLKVEPEEANSRIAELEEKLEINSENGTKEKSKDDYDKKSSEDTIGLNKVVDFIFEGTDTESINIAVTKVTNSQEEFPDHMLNFEEYDIERMILGNIEFKNVGVDVVYGNYLDDFQAYTKEGQTLERVDQISNQDEIGKGRSASTDIYFIYPDGVEELDEIELDFLDYDKVLATFRLPVD